MYIGPWQEYRLAQIQDDAIQRLRREWEDRLRVELPEGDDTRIRELMQPLVAKLPALLLAAKPSTKSNRRVRVASETAPSTRPTSAASTEPRRAHSRRTERLSGSTESDSGGARFTKPTSNQDTHDTTTSASDKPPVAPRTLARKKPKKPSSAPLTALDQVQKRKRMFASWIKHAASANTNTTSDPNGQANAAAATQCGRDDDSAKGDDRLPPLPLPPSSPRAAQMLQSDGGNLPGTSSQTRLPSIPHATRSGAAAAAGWDMVYESIVTGELTASATAAESSTIAVASVANPGEIDLEDSVDEEEVNNFLNWTDTLACPNDLDDSTLFDE